MLTLKKIDEQSATLLSQLSIDTLFQAYHNIHSTEDLEAYCRHHYTIASMKALLNEENIEAVVAFDHTTPVGFYVSKHHELNDKNTQLKQLYVLSSHYGKRLGHTLFERAIENAVKRDSHWIYLYVSNRNDRAKAFYKKRGFEQSGAGPDIIVGQDTLQSSIMSLCIQQTHHNTTAFNLL